jgi:hypothetical protein
MGIIVGGSQGGYLRTNPDVYIHVVKITKVNW